MTFHGFTQSGRRPCDSFDPLEWLQHAQKTWEWQLRKCPLYGIGYWLFIVGYVTVLYNRSIRLPVHYKTNDSLHNDVFTLSFFSFSQNGGKNFIDKGKVKLEFHHATCLLSLPISFSHDVQRNNVKQQWSKENVLSQRGGACGFEDNWKWRHCNEVSQCMEAQTRQREYLKLHFVFYFYSLFRRGSWFQLIFSRKG